MSLVASESMWVYITSVHSHFRTGICIGLMLKCECKSDIDVCGFVGCRALGDISSCVYTLSLPP